MKMKTLLANTFVVASLGLMSFSAQSANWQLFKCTVDERVCAFINSDHQQEAGNDVFVAFVNKNKRYSYDMLIKKIQVSCFNQTAHDFEIRKYLRGNLIEEKKGNFKYQNDPYINQPLFFELACRARKTDPDFLVDADSPKELTAIGQNAVEIYVDLKNKKTTEPKKKREKIKTEDPFGN